MLATGISLAVAAAIAVAPPSPAAPHASVRAESVALTGAWQELAQNVQMDLANLSATITNYPPLPILSQLAQNASTYARWLQYQDGGTPLKVVQTMTDHARAVAVALASVALLMPLSFVGAFIAPAVMAVQLVADTAQYPSTPQTVLQAFIDAPAVYLNTTLNCCTIPLAKLSFGLLNPGPVGYLLTLPLMVAAALQIPTSSQPAPSGGAAPAATGPASPAAARQAAPAPAVAQSRRAQSIATGQKTVVPRSAKRPAAVRKAADARAEKATAGGKGQSARPGSRGTR